VEPPELRALRLAEQERRARLLRRLRALLGLGLAAFTLAAWSLARTDDFAAWLPFGPGPSRTVRQHLEALNRGELRTAYGFFSPQYQRKVSFDVFHQLVVTHRAMFRTRQVSLYDRERDAEHAVLESRLLSADGERYVARFTLVRREGRWWIDDIRWGAAPRQRDLIRV
jgi:hypothetical protein